MSDRDGLVTWVLVDRGSAGGLCLSQFLGSLLSSSLLLSLTVSLPKSRRGGA